MRESQGFLERPEGQRLAWRKVSGQGPTVVWLGGFRSDMTGTKAQALADWARERNRAFVRFDYFGHGESSGDFVDGTISRWREDALAVLDELTTGDVILVGSSMGGWLSCLVAQARPDRVKALLLVAPAADFTSKLMAPEMTDANRAEMAANGVWLRPSDYGDPYPISRALLEDGETWSILPGPLHLNVPVWILQGGQDADVPWRHALALSEAVVSENSVFTLIRDGDHRLSRPQDIARLIAALEELP
ncbi:MAG: alpha/beta hydrolase [Alphaproteobacteria bacterium PA2]|nr:MAG: alpha/beta hydrolase [Alphaproteobacteria bacterium PA2]